MASPLRFEVYKPGNKSGYPNSSSIVVSGDFRNNSETYIRLEIELDFYRMDSGNKAYTQTLVIPLDNVPLETITDWSVTIPKSAFPKQDIEYRLVAEADFKANTGGIRFLPETRYFSLNVTNTKPSASWTTPPRSGYVISQRQPVLAANFIDSDGKPYGDLSAVFMEVKNPSGEIIWSVDRAATTTEKNNRSVSLQYPYPQGDPNYKIVNDQTLTASIRFQDSAGTWSTTRTIDFVTSTAPGIPTYTGPIGLINTITPTLSATYVQEAAGAFKNFLFEVWQGSYKVTDSGWITGTYAPTLQWSTDYLVRVKSRDIGNVESQWSEFFAITTNHTPYAPTLLSPIGNMTVNESNPTFVWQPNDADGDIPQEAELYVTDLNTGNYFTGYSPKTIVGNVTQYVSDLAVVVGTARPFSWTMRTKHANNPNYGPLSAPAYFIIADSPTVVGTVPSTVETTNVDITWSVTPVSGPQADYQILLWNDAGNLIHDSGILAGDDTTYRLPNSLGIDLTSYRYQVVIHDTAGVEGRSNIETFTIDLIEPPTLVGLTATPIGGISYA